MATNAQILAAVLNKWSQPFIKAMMAGKVQSFGVLQNIESKVRATGWVGSNWTLLQDLSPLMESISGSVVTPILNRYLSQIDDASIPQMAHEIVDDALKQGTLKFLDGKIEIEREDLEELKRYLDRNLPYNKEEVYEVKM